MAFELSATAIDAPKHVLELLTRLHKLSLDEEAEIKDPHGKYGQLQNNIKNAGPEEATRVRAEAMRDKFIALDADKASFMYNLVRATGSLNVVEAGTSFGVSTIYLALAVGRNAKAAGKAPGTAKVIATEHEPKKAEQARAYWSEAGEVVEPWIELREGDLTKTLASNMPSVDFVLFDIWTPMVLPTLQILEPKLNPGAVLLADNVVASAEGYADFFSGIKAAGSKYKSMTLPFAGGLEMATYWP